MPCEETVKKIIYTAYKYSLPILKEKLINEAISVSLCIDLWIARSRRGYLGITCSFINNDYKRCEFVLTIKYVSVTVKLPTGSDYSLEIDPLAHEILPKECKYEGDDSLAGSFSTSDGKITYPSLARNAKNWEVGERN
ncbi:10225_t:CDS:2 [Dentiscutata heterogama]|uniref:10225_t:CDS:1 n=1 Tax=Dentiscutata heterogama TaxID=1316150 RepID=A0ACA9KD52_9GLOM|nr:10225_t:CDS:2 [Dentiscutata heterogama]